ncbi:MAG: hypothetical protein JJ953_03010 [Gracilimonas sp.]|uniref:hypothetical protein n=1 Tax=Gracilimonas TaxID=649462 RepID=UPI001B04BD7B|nr:hypothetical protein [Gracilimonas sp.]MBO6585055.1 hypothetical protein [Gracilimonas sp.]MBO6615674.1 hypothetical protein [Gracilimonas sp.]
MKYLAIIFLLISGCAEFDAALDQANQDMGSHCNSLFIIPAVYDSERDKYIENEFSSGNYNYSKEKEWAENRLDYYENRYYRDQRLGIYYDTSPISGARYRFHLKCQSWS